MRRDSFNDLASFSLCSKQANARIGIQKKQYLSQLTVE
jgi:hypothetical protein